MQVYLFEGMKDQFMTCEQVDDLIEILNNKYLLFSGTVNGDKKLSMQVSKFDEPGEVLITLNSVPWSNKAP